MKTPSKHLVLFSLFCYCTVMLALTTAKAFFVIGLLWRPEAQRTRGISMMPLRDLFEASSWFSPLFGYGGNAAFFVPFGVLLYVLLGGGIWRVTAIGMTFSLCIEVVQFIFMLGISDSDDVLFNTLGACVGALIAKLFGPSFYGLWAWLSIALAIVFAMLVIVGPRLGDPAQVVELESHSARDDAQDRTPPRVNVGASIRGVLAQ